MFHLFAGLDIYLSHIEYPAILSRIVELKPFLADPLNPIRPSQLVRPDVHLRHDKPFILFLKLTAQVWVHH